VTHHVHADRIGGCLGYLHAKPVIPNSTEQDQWGMEKCGVPHFGSIQWLICRTVSASAESSIVTVPIN